MHLLVLRVSSIGDVVHTLPAVSFIRELLPSARISWPVREPCAALVLNNAVADDVVVIPDQLNLASLSGLSWLNRVIRKPRFDAVVVFQPTLPAAVCAFFSGAPHRFGFEFPQPSRQSAATLHGSPALMTNTLKVDYMSPNIHVVEHNLKLAALVAQTLGPAALGTIQVPEAACFQLPPLSRNLRDDVATLLNSGVGQGRGLIVLLPGTLWPSKTWAWQSWSELACILLRNGYDLVLAGGPGEVESCAQIERAVMNVLDVSGGARCLNLAGKTSLLELAVLFDRAQLVIGGDTGPLHLAAAVGKAKVFGIYGSTPVARNGPYGSQCATMSTYLDCQPCFEPVCRLGTNACLIGLTPSDVFDRICLWSGI